MNKPIVPPNLRRLGQGEAINNGDYYLSEDDEFIQIYWLSVPGLITDETESEYFTAISSGVKQELTDEICLNSSGIDFEVGKLAVQEIEPPKALTYDDGKPALSRLPWGALKEMAGVMAYGARKYGSDRNYLKGMEYTRQVSCIMRHLVAALEGEDRDQESGELHAAHALTRCAFLVQNIVDGKVTDDRHDP